MPLRGSHDTGADLAEGDALTLDITYWLDASYRLVEAIIAETGFVPVVGAIAIFWLLVLVFLMFGDH